MFRRMLFCSVEMEEWKECTPGYSWPSLSQSRCGSCRLFIYLPDGCMQDGYVPDGFLAAGHVFS